MLFILKILIVSQKLHSKDMYIDGINTLNTELYINIFLEYLHHNG